MPQVGVIDAQSMKEFSFWGSLLVLKMLAMAALTARQRFSKKVFANPEDAKNVKRAKVAFDDPDVERVRRAHLNDLENILPWFLVTYLWLGTNPSPWMSKMLIRSFVGSRIVHTLTYAVFPQQPFRFLSFFMGYGITGYEAIMTLLHYH